MLVIKSALLFSALFAGSEKAADKCMNEVIAVGCDSTKMADAMKAGACKGLTEDDLKKGSESKVKDYTKFVTECATKALSEAPATTAAAETTNAYASY